jgi:hypothetical protein
MNKERKEKSLKGKGKKTEVNKQLIRKKRNGRYERESKKEINIWKTTKKKSQNIKEDGRKDGNILRINR